MKVLPSGVSRGLFCCPSGWFGDQCKYKCHCFNDTCDATGECSEANTCVGGWFGPACQYVYSLQHQKNSHGSLLNCVCQLIIGYGRKSTIITLQVWINEDTLFFSELTSIYKYWSFVVLSCDESFLPVMVTQTTFQIFGQKNVFMF
ncbi:unnamed protein product [Candidula unifasciata]|uniref:EGF-like domain-containing protein n=1 Tax=Candidula unifasciata TaxID=100452 RepID=A0A8S3ZJB3_9EUPU|nr:unnamed protein product [Candidula unifasciata]